MKMVAMVCLDRARDDCDQLYRSGIEIPLQLRFLLVSSLNKALENLDQKDALSQPSA